MTTFTAATKIAAGEGWGFWLIGEEVYRAPEPTGLDIYGHPMGKRWECDQQQWARFRAVFAWAPDVN